ncbi:hypothetical protein N7468_004535 [Penicillium chermesinum]|uniref:Uncharacterized protein n=1 Tax=Penicillium chermesinum TaxID=63820 RepID=A0A9W9TSN8_9EURO|nr:uncharacterized protein N7468_004535 [Penicillium chermesinum]KAJ5239916.1 hypothetical protein N7468_004535 [Penicillium chermesinum]
MNHRSQIRSHEKGPQAIHLESQVEPPLSFLITPGPRMKPSSSLLHTTLLTTLIHSSTALVGLSWNIPSAPSTGLTEITFPISMPSAPHKSGYYFADNSASPAPPTSATQVCSRAKTPPPPPSSTASSPASSTGRPPATRTATTARTAARGGEFGRRDVDRDAGGYGDGGAHAYRGLYAAGWVRGSQGSQVGFVEYYPWNSGSHSCGQLPATQVVFGNPVSAGMQGRAGKPHEYGDCVGQVDFRTEVTGDGYEVTVGF